MTVDEARAALLRHARRGYAVVDADEYEQDINALIAAVRAESREPYDNRADWSEAYHKGRADSDERLRALREALTAISEFSDEPEARMARAALDATTETCGWDTRRGDGPIGGPCALPAGHDGSHAALAATTETADKT